MQEYYEQLKDLPQTGKNDNIVAALLTITDKLDAAITALDAQTNQIFHLNNRLEDIVKAIKKYS